MEASEALTILDSRRARIAVARPSARTLPDYIPSPEQIAAECERIQASWSADEWAKRKAYDGCPRVELFPVQFGTLD